MIGHLALINCSMKCSKPNIIDGKSFFFVLNQVDKIGTIQRMGYR